MKRFFLSMILLLSGVSAFTMEGVGRDKVVKTYADVATTPFGHLYKLRLLGVINPLTGTVALAVAPVTMTPHEEMKYRLGLMPKLLADKSSEDPVDVVRAAVVPGERFEDQIVARLMAMQIVRVPAVANPATTNSRQTLADVVRAQADSTPLLLEDIKR